MTRRCAALALVVVLSGCAGDDATLTIGTKTFAEQKILAEIIRTVVHQRTGEALTITSCGDTFGCRRQLRSGAIDLMVEYSGTASIYAGGAGAVDLASLRRAYAPLGLSWLSPLGFDNGYRVAIAGHRARAENLDSIDDLAGAGPVRFACPPTYLHRPRDGLAALAGRYGIRLADRPLDLADPDARVGALLSGRADAAIVYATDAALLGRDVVLLDDSLDFFPPYDAVILVREDATRGRPELAAALTALSGTIDAKTMQKLNYAVRVEGFSPPAVARKFLRAHHLIAAEATPHSGPPVKIAAATADHLGAGARAAVRAARAVFPKRPVILDRVADPMAALGGGRAHLALVGGERFFTGTGASLVRVPGAEAAAVVGTRALHIIRRAGDTRAPFAGKLGCAPAKSGSARATRAVLAASGHSAVAHAPVATLLSEVADNTLDGAVFLAAAGDPEVAAALASEKLTLVPVAATIAVPPYLRPGRIPPATYPGQAAATDTLIAQLVIAGPTRGRDPIIAGGPGASAPARPAPLSIATATALVTATGVSDMPDPVLPSPWTRWPHDAASPQKSPSAPAIDTALSLAALAFLGWLVILYVRR